MTFNEFYNELPVVIRVKDGCTYIPKQCIVTGTIKYFKNGDRSTSDGNTVKSIFRALNKQLFKIA